MVDATGTSIGKGFAGAVKRHNFPYPGCDPRELACAPRAGVDWPESDPRPRVQGQAHVGTHGQRAPAPCRTWRSYESTNPAIHCSSRARFRGREAVESSFVRQSRRAEDGRRDASRPGFRRGGTPHRWSSPIARSRPTTTRRSCIRSSLPTWREARRGTKAPEVPFGGSRRRSEALAPEGAGARPGRQHPQPDLAGRRRDVCRQAAEFRSEGESQDVPERHAIDTLRAVASRATGGRSGLRARPGRRRRTWPRDSRRSVSRMC